MVLVPNPHYLVHAATVYAAGQAAHLLDEVTEKRGSRRKFLVIYIAIQGLVQSEDEFRHVIASYLRKSKDQRCPCTPTCLSTGRKDAGEGRCWSFSDVARLTDYVGSWGEADSRSTRKTQPSHRPLPPSRERSGDWLKLNAKQFGRLRACGRRRGRAAIRKKKRCPA